MRVIKYAPDYCVDTYGDVYSFKHGPARKLQPSAGWTSKYLMVTLYWEGKVLRRAVHRLVAEFYLDLKKGQVVNHKNGNTFDNRLQNLEIVTHKEKLGGICDEHINN